ncbi:vacuolar segregation subunit 7-domain-containing protein [Cercophora scortea]|uniref:Vacuolar segregation subunit 7-domain-containing protein n=1 Tax=Cercophora scortea TaxID=314031 RepID=A0AAE0MC71_9PEZI|nr:vacuolar segregation subunit 7-domain-containing protein [Cercophora scortea]
MDRPSSPGPANGNADTTANANTNASADANAIADGDALEASRSRSRSSSSAQIHYPTLSRESTSSTVTITPRTDSWPSKWASQTSAAITSAPSSAAASPLPSREPSPTRPLSRTSISRPDLKNVGTRSRKNSQQDLSPSRSGKPNTPAPSSTSRTLSSINKPTLLPTATDPNIKAPVPIKSPTTLDHLRESPRWPVSPRLRSPPPILNKPNVGLPRRGEHDAPLINLQRATPPHPSPPDAQPDTETDDIQPQTGSRTPARAAGGSASTLETVQEASPLSSPRALDESMEEKLGDSIHSEAPSQLDAVDFYTYKASAGKASANNMNMNESGSESGSIKASRRSGITSAPSLTSRQSSASVKPGGAKGKAGEGSLQSMTVETETVTSIPQVALAPGVGGVQGSNGSLRTKPSTETIRPKKEKKKSARKQPAVTTGTASSKADIFEAKVASAVEEANSSDSEETFVYDSNPPDGRDRPQRFHSRTPSATSMVSQVDRNGMRSIHAVMENTGPPITVKKSMKFVNSYNSNANENSVGEDDGRGTGRSNAGSTRGTVRHHHHIGRWGRNGAGNGHPSLFQEPSPFSASLAAGINNPRQSSGPPSPRYGGRGPVANSKRVTHLSAGYDLDDTTTGADDETTPLVQSATVRSGRSGRSRRGLHSLRAMESQSYRSPPSFLNRFASCLVLTVMLLLVVSGAIGFMFATSQPLSEIQLVSMEHIVASEQELMLDLTISAHNPNIVVVVVDAADIEVFAKSPHAGTDSEWWRHTHPGEIEPARLRRTQQDGGDVKAQDDSPLDPPPDESAPNMRLGTITGFNSALSFEGSFFHSGISVSTGEVRLKSPGNGTVGGPERWERIMEDEFQLILKGTLRYTLPLSQRIRTATILGKTTVKKNAANDPALKPKKLSKGEVSITF